VTMLTNIEIADLMRAAEQEIKLLGVTAFDFPWEDLAVSWATTCAKNITFRIYIMCESDNMLFARSFTSDTDKSAKRRTFRELKFIRDRAIELHDFMAPHGTAQVNEECLELKVMHLPIPITIAKIDARYFAAPALDAVSTLIEEIDDHHPWRDAIVAYVDSYFDPERGKKYSANANDEILELFDHDRVPRGIYPRDSFYDTDYSQLVVWALIFDRRGRVLIHRRKDNAKDNRGMWDKSVGGHVDFSLDTDTSRTVVREMIEELFHDESSEAGFRAFSVTDKDTLFLGEWRPEARGRSPFVEIAKYERQWAFFRLRESQHVYTPRLLPDGKQRRLRVIADVFVVVAAPFLTPTFIENLKNSDYKLLELTELKSAMDRGIRQETTPEFENGERPPSFTPDLTNIMTGGLRDTLEEFAQYVKRYLAP
jgi:NUDIX domain